MVSKDIKKHRYKWSILQNFTFGSCTTNNFDMEHHNEKWFLFECANHCYIDFDLGPQHIEWQKKLAERNLTYSFIAEKLNNSNISTDFNYTPKENDKLLIYLDDTSNELSYSS